MGADETATLDAFRNLRHSLFEPLVRSHQGIVVKHMGDGWLVEFSSALDAVRCAIAVQEHMAHHDTIKLRIGVHVGDIIHDDEGDIHGDGVNIACRLEGIASSGGIAISDQTFSLLDGTMTPDFAGGGERDLKNISRPVRVWDWSKTPNETELLPDNNADTTPTILLEEFTLGGDVDEAADLALDIKSGLQNALANRSGIRVATVSDGNISPSYRLSGRCRVAGGRCRIHLSITVAADGETCWSDKIDGEIDDMFAFVDDVVWRASAAIRVQVNAFAGAAYATTSNDSLTVQQLLSKAAYLMHQFDAANMKLAQETTETAVARAPENPMALSMYSYALMHSVPLAMNRVADIDSEKVLAIADKAVHHGPKVDYAFHNRARIRLWLRRDHYGCVQDARRALAINPGFHFATEDLALADIFGANVSTGVESLETIVTQFPTHPTTPYRRSILAVGYTILGDTPSALTHALDAYERRPAVRLHALAYAAAASGDISRTGSAEFRKMVDHHNLNVADAKRFPFEQEKETETLAAIFRQAGLPD